LSLAGKPHPHHHRWRYRRLQEPRADSPPARALRGREGDPDPAGGNFVTPLSVSSLTGEPVYQELFDSTAEAQNGTYRAVACRRSGGGGARDRRSIARLAAGLAPDLASTALLATDKPVLIAPAMNVRMWEHAATRRNVAQLARDGINVIGPNEGEMACGEFGAGRMAEPDEILDAIETLLNPDTRLAGLKALVTAGPTHEPIDPVRYLANRSRANRAMRWQADHMSRAVCTLTS